MFTTTFNPFTGQMDYVTSKKYIEELAMRKALEAIEGIKTSNINALGNVNMVYDPVACKYVELSPTVVTDEDGNIVVEVEEP